jgi:Permuted papain-like amidase enzyme, YaeF/YiiX, C92 family
MKQSVAITLGSGVLAVVLAAYLVSYATTVRDPVEWKDGDVVAQDSRVENILPLFAADGSGFTHVGVVEARPQGAVVIEATDKVRETPMREFLSRGQGKAFAVFRVGSLSEEQGKAVVAAAKRQMGKPNDFFLGKSWDQLYSSELVRLAFSDIGLDIGRLQKMNRVVGDLQPIRSQFLSAWSSNEDCHKRNFDQNQCWLLLTRQEVVTPASIVNDERMTKVYEVAREEPRGFTLSRAAEHPSEPKP